MKSFLFTIIVAAVAITGITITALFGTADVQKNVIPALIIAAIGLSALYRFNEKQFEGASSAATKKHSATTSKNDVSEAKASASVEILEEVAA